MLGKGGVGELLDGKDDVGFAGDGAFWSTEADPQPATAQGLNAAIAATTDFGIVASPRGQADQVLKRVCLSLTLRAQSYQEEYCFAVSLEVSRFKHL